MENLFFHPRLVHVPIALAVLVPLAAATLIVVVWRGWLPARAWWLVVAMQAGLVGSGVAALRSGEREEERVEEAVPEHALEAHEEAAEIFVQVGAGVLVVMIAAGVLAGTRAGRPLAMAATLASLAVFGLGARVGEAGGRLVYVYDAARVYAPAVAPGAQPGSGGQVEGEREGGERDDD